MLSPEQILRNCAIGKSAAMYYRWQSGHDQGLRRSCGEHMHVVRKAELFRNDRGRIVIPGNQIGVNATVVKPNHLTSKEQTGTVVFPIAIIEVTCNNQRNPPAR